MVKKLFNQFIENFIDRPLKFNIFLHHNADPDAICSAYAFGELISQINPDVEYQQFLDTIAGSWQVAVSSYLVQFARAQ